MLEIIVGKVLEKVIDAGGKWLETRFKDYPEKAREKFEQHHEKFIQKLSNNLKSMVERGDLTEERLEKVMEQPDFWILLQKTILNSSQTEVEEKHILMARLVAERLKAEPESILSLASKMACDAIVYATPRQLQILGVEAVLTSMRPISLNATSDPESYLKWTLKKLTPFENLEFRHGDLNHLEALSCIKWTDFFTRDLASVLSLKDDCEYEFDIEKFKANEVGRKIYSLWSKPRMGLQTINLTTLGMVMGIFVSDFLTGDKTDMSDW